jgi:hypothetical protein
MFSSLCLISCRSLRCGDLPTLSCPLTCHLISSPSQLVNAKPSLISIAWLRTNFMRSAPADPPCLPHSPCLQLSPGGQVQATSASTTCFCCPPKPHPAPSSRIQVRHFCRGLVITASRPIPGSPHPMPVALPALSEDCPAAKPVHRYPLLFCASLLTLRSPAVSWCAQKRSRLSDCFSPRAGDEY